MPNPISQTQLNLLKKVQTLLEGGVHPPASRAEQEVWATRLGIRTYTSGASQAIRIVQQFVFKAGMSIGQLKDYSWVMLDDFSAGKTRKPLIKIPEPTPTDFTTQLYHDGTLLETLENAKHFDTTQRRMFLAEQCRLRGLQRWQMQLSQRITLDADKMTQLNSLIRHQLPSTTLLKMGERANAERAGACIFKLLEQAYGDTQYW